MPDLSSYDVIFPGFPNWWDTLPMPVMTLSERGDFSGKRLRQSLMHLWGSAGRKRRGGLPVWDMDCLGQ